MCNRRRCLGLVSGFALLALGITCAGLYVHMTYSGGCATLRPMESVVLDRGYSSFWCQGLLLESEDPLVYVNASVFPGRPRMDESIRRRTTTRLVFSVPERDSHYLRLYLPSTSKLRVSHCASQRSVTSYVFLESDELPEECYESVLLGSGYLADECGEFVKERAVSPCYDHGEDVEVDVDDADGCYAIFYKNPSGGEVTVKAELSLDRPSYDLSERAASCDRTPFCYLPLDWYQSESVVIQTGVEGSKLSHTIVYACQPNYLAYALIFGLVPLLTLSLVAAFGWCCSRRRRRQKEADHRNGKGDGTDREALLPPPLPPKAYGTFDDVTMDPLPGPSLVPSAPPVTEPPKSEVAAPYVIHEPPPTYEESMKVDKGHNVKS